MDEYGAYRLKLSIMFTLACIGFLIVIFALNLQTEVMNDRYSKNIEPLLNGKIPIMEYPPFALVFIAVPGIFGQTVETYEVCYVTEILAFMIIGLIYTDKLAEHLGRNRKNGMLAYSILVLLLLEFVVDRYDIFPTVLTLVSFYCFLKNRYAYAFILVAIGLMTKLYPALFCLIYFFLLAAKKEWCNLAKGVSIFIVTMIVIITPIMIIEPEMFHYFLDYHMRRPLQIESFTASSIYLLTILGLTTVTKTSANHPGNFGSDNLVGFLPDIVVGYLTPIMVICIVSICFYFLYIYRETDSERGLKVFGYAIIAVILTFILIGKVFSAQYLIWIIPPILFVLILENNIFSNALFKLTVTSFIMTQVEFVYNIGILHGGANIDDLGMIIIFMRNVIVAIILYVIIKNMRIIQKNVPKAETF